MADESTDISFEEELSICGRWLEDGKVVEHFLGLIHVCEVTAEALSQSLFSCLDEKAIPLQELHGLRFDGASTISDKRSGVQKCMRVSHT